MARGPVGRQEDAGDDGERRQERGEAEAPQERRGPGTHDHDPWILAPPHVLGAKIFILSRRGTHAASICAARATRSSDSALPGQYFSTRPRSTQFRSPSTTTAATR